MPQPRKSLENHRLSGTRPHYVDDASNIRPGRPHYPRNISVDARRVFKRLCQLLEQRRTLTQGDSELLRLYAYAFTRHEEALDHLAKEGTVCFYTQVSSKGEPHKIERENIWLKIAQDSEKFQRACLSDLGLNPLQRGKVKPTSDSKPKEDEFLTRNQAETQMPVGDEIDLNTIDETVVH